MRFSIVFVGLAMTAMASAAPAAAKEPVFMSAAELHHLLYDASLQRTYLEEVEAFIKPTNNSAMATPHYYFDQRLIEKISVGNPPQNFRLAVETGATRMFLFDWSYPGEWRQEIPYDPEKSHTAKNLKKPFVTRTGGLEARGKTYQDELLWKSHALEVSQNFGLVTEMDFNSTFPEHGVLGLGWLPEAEKINGPESSPILNLLLKRGDESRKYTLIVREHGTPIIVWGAARLRANPPLKLLAYGKGEDNIPIVKLDGFRYDRVEDFVTNRAAFDTGYSVIGLPTGTYHNVISQIKPKFDPVLGNFVVDCSHNSVRLAAMSFRFEGIWYSVRAAHFVLDRDFPNEACVLAVGLSPDSVFYLGLPFLRTAAVVFDAEKDTVALAPYKWNMEEPVPN